MTGEVEERLRFDRSDTHVVDELRAAEALLRDESSRMMPDAKMAGLLADVFHRWARMGRFDADFLNRAGGAETVLLARRILEQHENRP